MPISQKFTDVDSIEILFFPMPISQNFADVDAIEILIFVDAD